MRIICLNGWGGKLHDELLSYLRSPCPDILCLQEVVHTPDTTKDWLTYRDGDHVLPQRANFFRDVCRALPEHTAVFCPAARGSLWDGDVPVPSQWGLATFVHSSMPIVGQIQRFVHKDYLPDGFGDHPRSRCSHGVRVFDHSADRFVAVTHMHGLRDLNGKMDTPERAAQAQRLLASCHQLAGPGDLEIVCGDFNVEPTSQTLSMFSQAGYVDLVERHGIQSTRTSHYEKPEKFADYMLINSIAAVQSFEVPEQPIVSDHRPLVLDV